MRPSAAGAATAPAFGTNETCTIQTAGQGGDGSTNITAGFDKAPPPASAPPSAVLSVAKNGTGTGYVGGDGGIDCGPACAATFFQGTSVKLLAVPDDGSTFTGWTGGGCSAADTCAVTLDSDTQVTATFAHVDREAPHLRTSPAAAKRGKTAALRFRVYDDSGRSRELLTIMQGKVTIGRVAGAARPGPVRACLHRLLARPGSDEARQARSTVASPSTRPETAARAPARR